VAQFASLFFTDEFEFGVVAAPLLSPRGIRRPRLKSIIEYLKAHGIEPINQCRSETFADSIRVAEIAFERPAAFGVPPFSTSRSKTFASTSLSARR
jgi:hypothetical protein